MLARARIRARGDVTGSTQGAIGEIALVVNGSVIPRDGTRFYLPAGMGPEAVKTVAFRYDTPCGVFDVPHEIPSQDPLDRDARRLETRPAANHELWPHRVIVEADGADRSTLDVVIGARRLDKAKQYDRTSSVDGWDKTKVGQIFGTECAAEHEVKINGAVVGKLRGRLHDAPYADLEKRDTPIFITNKAACYRLERAATESKDVHGMKNYGSAEEVRFRGPGAFHLPFDPQEFGHPPNEAEKPTTLYEVPCGPASLPPAGTGSGAPAEAMP